MDSDEASARVYLLGKPALFIGGRLEPFGGPRKAIALLAYVLLHRDRALSRAAVAEQFWPDEDDESARASLRRHLYRALAALPEAPAKRPWVIADKVTLRWNPEALLEIDTSAYERLSAAGQRESAVNLYRGDYLEDFYDEWMLPERERLRELQSANLVALVEERRRALDYPGAIAFAQSMLRLDPLREDAIRRLMSLRFAAGDRSGALADFETFSRRLRDELAADPMPETLALREAIRSNDLSTLERGQVGPARVARPGFPFTGRSAALQALREGWESAARGSASTAIVSGEAGAGKSRLIAELMAIAEAQGGRVMFGTTATIESEPYQPIAEALRGALPLMRFDRLEPAKVAALALLVPELRDYAPNLPNAPLLEPERERRRLFDAVASTLEHIAEKRPLLMVLEDLHWAGAVTIELLAFCTRRLRGKSVLSVISFREEDVDGSSALHGFLRSLDGAGSRHVALGPLEVLDIRALVSETLPAQSEALADELFLATEGNALFVTELLRERLSGATAGAMPAGIAGTTMARVTRLSPAARSLVETAAVAGTGFDVEVVRRACGWSYADVFDALDELLDRALVRMSPQRRGDYAFSHQLVHAAIYNAMEVPARQRLHWRLGKTLEELFEDRASLAATVARHFDAAGFAEAAVARFLTAVRYARDVFAHSEAIALASRAIELCSNARDLFELHRLREEASARTGEIATRRGDCDALTTIAESLDDDDLLGTALSRSIVLNADLAKSDAAAADVAALRALGERSGSSRWIIEAALAKANLEFLRSDQRTADTTLGEVEPIVAALGDDMLGFEYWCRRGTIAAPLDPQWARTCLERAGRYVGADRFRAARALRLESLIADARMDPPAVLRAAREQLNLYREIGDLEGEGIAHQALAAAAWYRLDLTDARRHLSQALQQFERIENPFFIARALLNRGSFAHYLGQFAEAEADYLHVLSMSKSFGYRGFISLTTAYLAGLASYRGDHVRARALAEEAVELAREQSLGRAEYLALEFLGVAERELGMFDLAREHLEATLRYRRENDMVALDPLLEIVPAYLSLGAYEEAVAAADELMADSAADRAARVAFPARPPFVAAAAYEAVGQIERARALRAQARTLLLELAGRIEDEPSRRGYLGLAFHQEILAQA